MVTWVGAASPATLAAAEGLEPVRAFLAHMRHADVALGEESTAWVESSLPAARELAPGAEPKLLHRWLSVSPARPCTAIACVMSLVAAQIGSAASSAVARSIWTLCSISRLMLTFCVQVARLVALSHGQLELKHEHWQHMRQLEHQRMQRERLVRQVGPASWLASLATRGFLQC